MLEPSEEAALAGALDAWRGARDAGPLGRLLDRELDQDGVPRRLAVGAWWDVLGRIVELERGDDDRFDAIDARLEGFARAALRFSRPDGTLVFADTRRDPRRGRLVAALVGRLGDPELETVARWWFPGQFAERRTPSPPFLPAFAPSSGAPLGMLRADWTKGGDLIAIDQRARGRAGALEVIGGGTRWLGPSWGGPEGPAEATFWTTGPTADCLEWTFRRGATRVTRVALFLRGRKLALLAEQVVGGEGPLRMEVDLAPGVLARPIAGSRALRLDAARASCAVLPIGLPHESYPTEHGSLAVESGRLVLTQRSAGRRSWLPLLVSWDATRNRSPATWKGLTVSENSRVRRPTTAVATRVAWGAQPESLLVYRSLGKPALRAFLGHQTRSRVVVGVFDAAGDVGPLLRAD